MIFKRALAIWLRSLTVEICCEPEILETVLRFLKCIVAKSFVNVNIFRRTLNLQC